VSRRGRALRRAARVRAPPCASVSLTVRVLLGLAAGLAAGALVGAAGTPSLHAAVRWVEPAGTIWINLLRMTVVPLVVAGIVTGAAALPDPAVLGRIGGRGLAFFVVVLAAAATFTVIVAGPLFAWLPIDPAGSAALREAAAPAAGAAAQATGFPDLRQWLIDLVPVNPVRAAADGALLPLIVFALGIGLAIGRIGDAERGTLVRFFRGIFEAMLVLVRWILRFAPYGVFALALPLATRLGLAAAGAVVYYILVVAGICTLFIALYYGVAAVAGAPIRDFARATAPAQAVAFSARSSLAALPAMIDGGARHLGFGPRVRAFFLPLSASMFRTGSAIGIPCGVLFVARLYGIELGALELTTIAVASALITFSVPGVPGGSILIMMPVLQAVGVPPEGVGILLGVDTIPDMFRTTSNVTGHMAAAVVVGEGEVIVPAAAAPAVDAAAGGPA
jgi:proton glutamate symport protein